MKKVSIILPVYNGENRVTGAIESILGQSYSNIELVIVNDCSTDGTKEIVESIAAKDDRVRIINNEKNQKLPQSLNNGFAVATGDYYTWTSDDNRYHETAIQRMVETLENNPGYNFVYAGYTLVDMNGEKRECLPLPPKELAVQNVVGACFLYTKKLADLIGKYDINLFLAEDYDYWIRAYKYGKLYPLDENLYDYYLHEQSLTTTRKKDLGKMTYSVLEKHFVFFMSSVGGLKNRNRFLYNMIEKLDTDERTSALEEIKKIKPFFPLVYRIWKHKV